MAASFSGESCSVEYNISRPSGYILTGTMIQANPSSSSTGATPVIVMMHGLLSERNHNFAPALAEALAKVTGHSVFRYDSRFAPDVNEPDFRYRFSGFEDDVDDLTFVLKQLKKDGYAPWALVGHSRGANDVLLASSKDHILGHFACDTTAPVGTPPLRLAVCALAARFTMPDMFRRIFSEENQKAVDDPSCGNQFTWHSKKGELIVTQADADIVRKSMDMAAVVKAIPETVPILHMHGVDDEVIAVDDARKFVPTRKEKFPHCDCELVVVGGSRHAFAGKKPQKQLIETVTAWICKQAEALGIPCNPWPLSPSDKGSKTTAAAKAARAEKYAASAAGGGGGGGGGVGASTVASLKVEEAAATPSSTTS
jgi:alpha-beta hydrolase superfamily lysophospholipase